MTAYNREKYIAESIESVLNQTYVDFELLISDDCSTDSTVKIANHYAQIDPRVKIISNKTNLGDYPNRNRVASIAKGDILFYVDSDDSIVADALGYLVSMFSKFPTCKYLTFTCDEFYKDDCMIDSETVLRRNFYEFPILNQGPGATAIYRDYFLQIGGFPELYGPSNDMYYNIKASISSPVILCHYKFLNYRIHSHQESSDRFRYIYTGYNCFNDFLFLPGLPLSDVEVKQLWLKNRRRFIVNLCRYFLNNGNLKNCLYAISMANFRFRDFIRAVFLI
jgi:glycosyltransferase involved in cell wall biosynthesis